MVDELVPLKVNEVCARNNGHGGTELVIKGTVTDDKHWRRIKDSVPTGFSIITTAKRTSASRWVRFRTWFGGLFARLGKWIQD